MRAYEFIKEEYTVSSSQPITLRHLHTLKLSAIRAEIVNQKRLDLMRMMYADPETEQQKFEQEKHHLELEHLRAETEAIKADAENKSAIALHKNAKSGINAEKQKHQHIQKLAKNGLGRALKT